MARFEAAVRTARALKLERPINALVGSIYSVATDKPFFHLTFDDGPHPVVTPRVLDVLEQFDATATFFVVTDQAQTYPDVLHEVLQRGHQVGLHSRTHMRLSTASWSSLNDEICRARRDLEELAEAPVDWFRPPYGAGGLRTRPVAGVCRMKSLLWSVDSRDWKGLTADNPLERTTQLLGPGGILLMHDTPFNQDGDDDAAAGFIPKDELTGLYLQELADRSLRSVSIDELMSAGKPKRKTKLG